MNDCSYVYNIIELKFVNYFCIIEADAFMNMRAELFHLWHKKKRGMLGYGKNLID